MTDYKPYPYQRTAIDWVLEHPKCGLFLDMGLGKTVSTLTALNEAMYDYLEDMKILVIGPPRVIDDTWPSELEKWSHLNHLSYVSLRGGPKEREEALQQEADIYLLSNALVPWIVEYFGKHWPFNVVVVDELSAFKSHSTKRFKALKKVTPHFDRFIGLTGTPAPNGHQGLWSQVYLMDRGKRLGKNITTFRNEYCHKIYKGGFYDYSLRTGAEEEIEEAIEDICISMSAKDYMDLKKPIIMERKGYMTDKQYKQYKKMETDAILSLGDEVITALSASTVTNKLLQLANGAIYDENKKAHHVHEVKLDLLEEIMEEADDNILCFYNFRSDLERILDRFPGAVKLEGTDTIKAWNEGKVKLLVAHPASCGHGLNLQYGGSILVWYGLNWSLELYLQANARLQRPGQKKVVRIYRLVTAGTIDERVLQVLAGKDLRQEELLDNLRAELKKR